MASDPKFFRKTIPPKGKKSEGLELVWLHGWGQDHSSLVRIANLFKSNASNILYDLPGFGKTAMLPAGLGTEAYGKALVAELRKTKPKKRIIVGHSFGCRVALRVARANPGLIDGLVLISAAGLPRKKTLGGKVRGLFIKIVGKGAHLTDALFKTRMKKKFRNRYGSRDYKAAGKLRETFVATVTENLGSIAREIEIPVLLIYGAEDTETPVEIGERFEALLPRGKLKILNGFGHLNILTEGAHQCQHSIQKFMGELEAI